MSVADDRRYWRERGIFQHVLLGLLLLLIALQPIASSFADGLVARLGMAAILVGSILAVSTRPRFFITGLILGVPALALLFVPGRIPFVLSGVLAIATLLFICVVFLYRISRRPIVTPASISSTLVVYLSLGVVWAHAYRLVEHLRPGSFTGVSGLDVAETQRALFYYSYVTLTTLGYGDISPVSPAARSLAIIEAITGQLYLVVLVASLVGMYLSQRQNK